MDTRKREKMFTEKTAEGSCYVSEVFGRGTTRMEKKARIKRFFKVVYIDN